MRTRNTKGRSIATLMHDFGHDLPNLPELEPEEREARMFRSAARRGAFKADRGWAPAAAPIGEYRMTSDQAPAFWPFISGSALPPTGAPMGIDQHSGGTFHADPFGWVKDPNIPVTNPNIVVIGKPGQGKSAGVKCFINRMFDFGYRAFIPGDIKDEYEPLCRAYGVEPFAVGPGLPARINPLSLGPLGVGWEKLSREEAISRAAVVFRRWLTLMRALVGSQKIGERWVPFGPTEEMVVKQGLQRLTGYASGDSRIRETTIPKLWHLLDNPTAELVEECRFESRQHFFDETRLLRDALGQLVSGALAGLFDDHTTIDVDWEAPIQSLSLSRLVPLGDEATGIALCCVNSWATAMREVAGFGDRRVIPHDESWREMRLGPQAVRGVDASFRLSRTAGDIHILVLHKPSDLLSVGDQGSQAQNIAKDLLHLADTKILYGQDAGVANDLENLFELGPMARHLVTDWAVQAPGRALWKVGGLQFKVEGVIHPAEKQLTYTNQALG